MKSENSRVWAEIGQGLVERLLISTSYSFVSQIRDSLTSLSGYASRDLFATVSMCVFSATAVSLKTSNFGLKRVFSMLAAHSLTSTIPIPQEQNSKLVLPGIMLYLSSIATIIWIILICTANKNTDVAETITVIVDYVVLFAASRGLARFQATSEMHTLGVISMVFLICPRPTKPKDKETKRAWSDQIIQLSECLAVRGVIKWTTSGIKGFTGVSGLTSAVFLNWALLIWNPFTITSQLAPCGVVLSFMNAQQSAELLQTYLHNSASASLFLVLLFLFIQAGVCPHAACSVCKIGISIAMTSWLEKWVQSIFMYIERFFVYILVFIILEHLLKELKNTEELVTDKITNESSSGIAHAQATLGLPNIADSSGNH